MTKENKKFSAFKLFYDELIYKKNPNISYYKIDRNIKNIDEIVHYIIKTSTKDSKLYTLKLNRYHKRLKENLETIYKYNKDLYEFYYLLYKTKMEICNDKIEDMPLIIACSFYEDYRLDNLEDSSLNRIPKYSSLEKKEIRKKAKQMTSFEYFISLIEEKNNIIFTKFLEKAKYIMSFKVNKNETFDNYMSRLSKLLYEFTHVYSRLENKLKRIGCSSEICDKMFIAYKIKLENWNEDIKQMIINYFETIYNQEIKESQTQLQFNSSNDLTYEEYTKIITNLCDEKNNYIQAFENDEFVPLTIEGNNYEEIFKNSLINSYFDYRYKNKLNTSSKVNEFVDRTLDLYSLANDLVNQIFERIIFDSGHSKNLGRNNDAKSAILTRIYDLYEPKYLTLSYENAKKEFEELLDLQSSTFKSEYKRLLDSKKREYDFHGPIPSKDFINAKIIEKRKQFILDYCITELKSRDFLENYDTRDYDLLVMSEDIPNNDMVSLYRQMKEKIANFDFSKLFFMNSAIIDDEDERKVLLSGAQELTVKSIYHNLNINKAFNPDLISNYRDICFGYLNEQMIFSKEKDTKLDNYHNYELYLKERNLFNNQSKWQKFITNNKLKGNISR